MDPHRFRSVLSPDEYDRLLELIASGARELKGRVVWNVNSTAKGGGVVELLRPLLGYSRGAGVDARWVVISGAPDFFEITRRLHNHLHAFKGDGGSLGECERAIYERRLAAEAAELVELMRPRDIVILHDPQTAGLVDAMRSTGATVIWRCHVGRDHRNPYAREAWTFLRNYVREAHSYVFSRREFVWDGLPEERISIIHPSIDAFSPKNEALTSDQVRGILSRGGDHSRRRERRLIHSHGRLARTCRPPRNDDRGRQADAGVKARHPGLALGPPEGSARCDECIRGAHQRGSGRPFGDSRPIGGVGGGRPRGHLGPRQRSVGRERLPAEIRARVHLASLPMDDLEENAAIVNALHGRASVVVQKSLAEGFGLTVAEAMWKQRPVVASRVGGIQDQIVDGESGILISHPRDHEEFGHAVVALLENPGRAGQIGRAAQLRIRDHFLGPYHLRDYFDLIQRLATESGVVPAIVARGTA
jgi:trehalose synthase